MEIVLIKDHPAAPTITWDDNWSGTFNRVDFHNATGMTAPLARGRPVIASFWLPGTAGGAATAARKLPMCTTAAGFGRYNWLLVAPGTNHVCRARHFDQRALRARCGDHN